MTAKEEKYFMRYVLAFVLASVLFSIVFMVGNSVSYLNYQKVSRENSVIKSYLNEMDQFLQESSCSNSRLEESGELLDRVGSRLSLLEKRFGKLDSRVLEQKKDYTELEFKHYAIVRQLNEKCATDFLTILFFYSNEGNLADASERSGYVLGSFKNKDPSRILIYSFDSNLEHGIIESLMEDNGVDRVPAALIDGQVINVRDIDDLEEFF